MKKVLRKEWKEQKISGHKSIVGRIKITQKVKKNMKR